MFSCVNGETGGLISIRDRGLAYGDGLFETARITSGHIPLWTYHEHRLLSGCERLRIPFSSVDLISGMRRCRQWLAEQSIDQATLKITVTRGPGERGYGYADHLSPTLILDILPAVQLQEHPVELDFCRHRLPCNPALAGLKHLNRLDNILLKIECQERGSDDGVAMDTDGHLVETTASNLFFTGDGVLHTPVLDCCGVAGVMRQYIIEELAPKAGIEVRVCPITTGQLHEFQGAFCCNSLRGMWPVTRIDTFSWPVSPIFLRLREQLQATTYTDAD